MALSAEYPLQIDVNNSTMPSTVAVQGDHIGRKVRITLLSQGEAVDLTGCIATVKCSFDGSTIAIDTCDITENEIVVVLTKYILAYSGRVKVQVTVTDANGAILSSPIIYLYVSEAISTAAVETVPEFSVLADLTGKITAVLNDPAVGDVEVMDARGGYPLLGDRLNAMGGNSDILTNFLDKPNHAKDIFTQNNWGCYGGMTFVGGATYVAFSGVKDGASPTVLLGLDKTLNLSAAGSKMALVKIRLRSSGQDLTVSIKGLNNYFSSSNVIAANTDTLANNGVGNTTALKANEWRTIWLVTTGVDLNLPQVGVLVVAPTADFNLHIGSVDVYYSADSVTADMLNIKSNIVTNTADISTANTNISALQDSVSELKGFTGLDDDILGLQVDYENKLFKRLAGAIGKTAGADFDVFEMYGGRRRCNVADDGTITAYYGDEEYSDSPTNQQVMVYQPAFYYRVVPLKLEKNTATGIGYHIRKANYYVSDTPKAGFKLHPAFYDENGNAVDYILYSAYEGSLYSNHHVVDDDKETSADMDLTSDLIFSAPNRKTISGLYKNLTRANFEKLASNRGAGWHCDTIKSVSANQLLMMIELGTMNTQSTIGPGVVSITDNTTYNCSSITGSTAELGNATGQASSTINRQGSTTVIYTESGKVAVSYRGIENPWGNIWKFISGINIWGNGKMGGGQPYIADDFNFAESKNSDNYKSVGFTLANSAGYINAMGYGSDEYDWLMMPSEVGGTSALPVGDMLVTVVANLDRYSPWRIGGHCSASSPSGGFCCTESTVVNAYGRNIGGRLLYIPTATV